MKTAVFAAALIIGATAAHASSWGDLLCSIKDTGRNNLIYTFGNNTENADGSVGGTFVETGLNKNGTVVTSQPGRRPVWIYTGNTVGGLTLYSRAAPGWSIIIGNINKANGIYRADAMLFNNRTPVGTGECLRPEANTAATVGDLGQ